MSSANSNSNNDGFFSSTPSGFSLGGPGGFLASLGFSAPKLNTVAKPVAVVNHTKAELEALKARIEANINSDEALKLELLRVLNELLVEDKIKDPSSGLVIGFKTYKNALEKGLQLYEVKSSLLGDLEKMIEAAAQAGGRRKRRRSTKRSRRVNKKRRITKK
jgi:hypothetical protein